MLVIAKTSFTDLALDKWLTENEEYETTDERADYLSALGLVEKCSISKKELDELRDDKSDNLIEDKTNELTDDKSDDLTGDKTNELTDDKSDDLTEDKTNDLPQEEIKKNQKNK